MPEFISESDLQQNNISIIAEALSPENIRSEQDNGMYSERGFQKGTKKKYKFGGAKAFRFLNKLNLRIKLIPDQELRHINSIIRRVDFLAAKIVNNDSGKPLIPEREEIKALAWALNNLTANYKGGNYSNQKPTGQFYA